MAFLILNGGWSSSGSQSTPCSWHLPLRSFSVRSLNNDCFVGSHLPLVLRSYQPESPGAKDKVRADIEYEVNIKAELEIAHLHEED